MITFGINFQSVDDMRTFMNERHIIFDSVGITSVFETGIGGSHPEIESKCKKVLGIHPDKLLSITGYLGPECNYYLCTTAVTAVNTATWVLWRYGVVFDVLDEDKALLLRLSLS
jgi:hypothetical protein